MVTRDQPLSFFFGVSLYKKQYIIYLSLVALGFGAGYFATPTKIKIVREKAKSVKEEAKTRVVYKEKVVYKDGTVIEKEVERDDVNTKEQVETEKQSNSETTKASSLTLSALAVTSIKELSGDSGAQVVLSNRIFGALNVSASYTQYKDDSLVGIGLGWSF